VKTPKEKAMALPNPFPAGIKATVTTTITKTPKYKFKKAGTNGNIIAVVLDESGSMNVCRDTTIAGFNEFVQAQSAADNAGAAYLTLNKFEGGNIRTVFADRNLTEVPKLDHSSYTPAGGTNLLDAIGHTIEQVNDSLDLLKKNDRPGVIILIMTDGEENCSQRYNNDMVKAMVVAAEKSDWSFVFLGANIDAFSVGSTFGMSALNSVNYSTANMAGTMAATSTMTTNMRSAKMAGLDTRAVYASTTMSAEDRERIK
jgi:hypothetical protein